MMRTEEEILELIRKGVLARKSIIVISNEIGVPYKRVKRLRREHFASLLAEQAQGPNQVKYCPNCERPGFILDSTKVCVQCGAEAYRKNIKKNAVG